MYKTYRLREPPPPKREEEVEPYIPRLGASHCSRGNPKASASWHCPAAGGGGAGRDELEGKEPQRRPQKRLGRRLEEVAEAVGGGYCRLQMPLKLSFAVRGTVAGHRLGALEGGGVTSPLSNASLGAGSLRGLRRDSRGHGHGHGHGHLGSLFTQTITNAPTGTGDLNPQYHWPGGPARGRGRGAGCKKTGDRPNTDQHREPVRIGDEGGDGGRGGGRITKGKHARPPARRPRVCPFHSTKKPPARPPPLQPQAVRLLGRDQDGYGAGGGWGVFSGIGTPKVVVPCVPLREPQPLERTAGTRKTVVGRTQGTQHQSLGHTRKKNGGARTGIRTDADMQCTGTRTSPQKNAVGRRPGGGGGNMARMAQHISGGGGGFRHRSETPNPPPCVTCSPSVVSLRGPGQSPVHSSPHDAASIFS